MNRVTPLLNVQDVARSLAFWRDLLGFEVVSTFDWEGRLAWARLKHGEVQLMLNGRGG
ncbi:VOC family protein [Phenylobacterium sp.]|jgi:catechol 2,3-dioxygenase-like lactoylglutathione lyase family enzyme|uniref:VOC family protein n=1 Tax=Phenylobacterium sp. TaxID=1871053 RepID=UPI002E364D7A|nr:VOC family protein [Phenylobacterium sp.]HEX2560656.1 VOC family protein [Phenylobacterium sp.]